MVQDPYKVLGITEGASPEEIKKAYRKKTKECHPDIHPDDPHAEAKMAEVNTAYDMLMNPEKYAKQRQQTGQQSGYYQGSSSAGQGYAGGNNQGYNSWNGDFGGFDFGDIFGFGFGYGGQIPAPTVRPGDSTQICRVIEAIQSRQYQQAAYILNNMVSAERNARWYYLSAFVNNAMGNTGLALEQIQRAVQMEPNNAEYQSLLLRFKQTGQFYRQTREDYQAQRYMQSCCTNLCLANLFCNCCC